MIKNYTLILMVSLLVLACSPKESAPTLLVKPQCLSGQSACTLKTEFGDVSVKFNVEALLAETPFTMTVETSVKTKDATLKVVSGYMEGDDMYMGKIPLFFERGVEQAISQNSNGIFEAKSLFGSCAQDHMRWKVWLTLEFLPAVSSEEGAILQNKLNQLNQLNQKKQIKRLFLTVSSFRNYQAFLAHR